MLSKTQLLDTVTPRFSDRQVALMIADVCIEMTDAPYRFAINHDIRPPKNEACPLAYDWTRKDRCGVEYNSRLGTRQWLTKALLAGYTVYRMKPDRTEHGFATSIDLVRRRAKYAQREDDGDDDIPF